jgi:hypothetical protein
MTGQIGADQGISDDPSCARLGTNGAKKFTGETVQFRGVDVRHATSIDRPRVERTTRRREDESPLIASAGSVLGQVKALPDQRQVDRVR